MTSQELETLIKKGALPPLCYIYGDEPFLVERVTRKLMDKAIDPSLKDFNFNAFYGNESKGVDIVDAAQTLPMFSDRRAVLVKRAELLKAEALEALLPYIQNPAETTCLVFNGQKIDQRKKFFQELKKRNALVEFKRLYDNKLPGFVQSEAQSSGKSMEAAAAELLAMLIGNNLQELASQLEKLVVYVGDRTRITVDDVKEIASSSKAFNVFELARFLGLRDLRNALLSLDKLMLNGEETPMMLGALSRHFRQLWRVREMVESKASQADISKETGINTFFLGEYLQQAKNFKQAELRTIFEELFRCDVLSKTGGSPYTLMHGLVYGICSGSLK